MSTVFSPMPWVRLGNGLIVANFSSPHPFRFTSGELLPACEEDRARGLVLDVTESETPNPGGWTDTSPRFDLSAPVVKAIIAAHSTDAHVVLVPLPVMQAWKAAGNEPGKLRVCRVADRVTKTIYPDRFAI